MPTPSLDSIIDETVRGTIKDQSGTGAIQTTPIDNAIDSAVADVMSPDFKMPVAPAPAAPVVPPAPPSMLDRVTGALKTGAEAVGELSADTAHAIESAYNSVTIPDGSQILFDFMNPSLAIARKAGEKMQEPSARAGIQTFVYGLPGTLKDIVAEVPVATALMGTGIVKGVTLGAVDMAQQQFGIPFTTIKTAPSSKPLPEALKELGVSPEVADSQIIPKIGEAVGSIAAWQGIASAMNYILPSSLLRFGGVARSVSKEIGSVAENAPLATRSFFGDMLPDVIKNGLSGAILEEARVRPKDEYYIQPGQPMRPELSANKLSLPEGRMYAYEDNPEVRALYGATLGAGLTVVGKIANAITEFVGYQKMAPTITLKDEIANHLYETGAVGSKGEAELQASRIVVKNIADAGGIGKVSKSQIEEALANIKAQRAAFTDIPLAPEGVITPEAPPTPAASPEGASVPNAPESPPSVSPISESPTPPIAPISGNGAAEQSIETAQPPLQAGQPPAALGPVPSDPAMIRDHVSHLEGLLQTADAPTSQVINQQMATARGLLVAYQDQAKETIFHVPRNQKSAGAGVEVVPYNDGQWQVRSEGTGATEGYAVPFHGSFDSKDEATLAGLMEVQSWVDTQLVRTDVSAASRAKLDKLRSDISGQIEITQPEPKPTSPPLPEPKEVVRGQVKTTKQPKPVDPIKGLNGVINRRATLPILSTVHVKGGQVTATDLDLALTLKTDKPDGIYQIVGKNFEQSGMDIKDFPALPALGEVQKGTLDRGEFISNLERISRFASTDQTRYVLNGVNLVVKGGKAQLVATDGRALSESDVMMPTPITEGQYILGTNPDKLVAALKALTGDTLRVHFTKASNNNVIQFAGDNGHVTQKLIEGNFPNFEQVRPTLSTVAHASRDEVAKAFAELKPYIKQGKIDSIQLVIKDNTMMMRVRGGSKTDAGFPIDKMVAVPVVVQDHLSIRPKRGTIVMPMKLNEGEIGVSLSQHYFDQAIKAVAGDNFYFSMSTQLNPMHFFGADPALPKYQVETAAPKPTKGKKGKAPSGAASVGAFADLPPTAPPPPTADVKTDQLPPVIELPELVQISKELLDGKLPEVHENLRVGSGEAFGVFSHTNKEGRIGLKADIFAGDGVQAVKTLAHEIGHMIDWLPDKTLKRGNVLGHLLALKKYMAGTYGELYKAKEIRAELKNMTHIWKPFDPKANVNYTAYRYRASEMYADAISVLFNNPGLLRETAPKFYRGWFEELDRRPEVKRVYFDTVDAIKSGGIVRTRDENLQAMYAAGDARAAAERQAAAVQYRNMIENVRYELIDRNEAIIKRRAAAGEVDPSEDPIYALEEMNYASSEAKAWVSSYDAIIASLKDNGITWPQLGDLLFHERVIGDATRAEQANPLGFTPKTSASQIKFMNDSMGEKKFGVLKKAADDFRANWKYVVDRLEKSQMLDTVTMEKIKGNPYYVTFDVFEKHIMSAYGPSASPRIFKSVGTLKEITNPATATLMKGISIIKAINRNTAAVKVVNFLSQNFGPSEVRPADTKWNGRTHVAVDPKEAHKGMIMLMEGGKLHGFYVDEYVAKSFERNPRESRAIIDVLSYTNQFFRKVFVQSNPGFQLFNLIRDFKRAYKNTPGIGATELIRYYMKNMDTAYKRALGFTEPIVKEMLEKKMLITVETKWGVIKEDDSISALVARYNESPEESKNILWRPFQKLFKRVASIGEAIEFMPKIAGYQYLKEHQEQLGLSDEVIGHMIRGQIGSPDFLRQGGGYSAYNQIFLFSNAIKEGWRSDTEVLRERPAEYLFKTAKLNLMPKLIMYAATTGFMGYGVKKIFDGVSEYDKANYQIIPLGIDANGKSVYLRVPEDEIGRFIGGVMWKILGQGKNRDIADLFAFMSGQAPNLTPSLGILQDILQYASGQNPYDYYRGRNALPDTVFQAQDWHTRVEFLKYLSNMGGLGIIHRFDTNKITPIKSELEKMLGLPLVDNIVGRFIKISDYGEYEDAKQVVASQQKAEAHMRLNEQDALADHINAVDKPNINDMVKLYFDMRKNGLLERGIKPVSLQEFKKAYDTATEKKTSDIYVDSMIFQAKTTPEKAALLAHYQLILPKAQYNQVFQKLLSTREIGPEVMILADRIRQGAK